MKCPRCSGEAHRFCPVCEGDATVSISTWAQDIKWQAHATYIDWRDDLRQWWRRKPYWYSVQCPKCDGDWYWQEIVVHYGVPGGGDGPWYECDYCKHGHVTPWRWLKWHYWITDPPAPLWKIQQIMIWWEHGEWIT